MDTSTQVVQSNENYLQLKKDYGVLSSQFKNSQSGGSRGLF